MVGKQIVGKVIPTLELKIKENNFHNITYNNEILQKRSQMQKRKHFQLIRVIIGSAERL